jgi:hypothetical protein
MLMGEDDHIVMHNHWNYAQANPPAVFPKPWQGIAETAAGYFLNRGRVLPKPPQGIT